MNWQLPTYAWHAVTGEMRRFDNYTPGPEWRDSPPAVASAGAWPDLLSMTKEQIEAFALERFGVDVDRRKSVERLAAELEAMRDE